jgi:DNA-binding NtrC family response regulator
MSERSSVAWPRDDHKGIRMTSVKVYRRNMAKILLVEDDTQLRSMLRTVLEDAGHEVEVAGNGKEAIRSYQRRPTDLLITDIIMPEEEGLEAIIKFHGSYPSAKIIAMSGGGFGAAQDYLFTAKLLGANHTLAKPFSNSDLLAGVKRCLGSERTPLFVVKKQIRAEELRSAFAACG